MGMRVPQIYGCYLYRYLICAFHASFELGLNELNDPKCEELSGCLPCLNHNRRG